MTLLKAITRQGKETVLPLLSYVQQLEGQPNRVRGERVAAALASLGLKVRREGYRYRWRRGTNLIVDFGGGEGLILASAHYDAYHNAPGANDNASGVAALLGCAEQLRGYRPRGTISLVFFDGEEPRFRLGPLRLGTAGSAAFVRDHPLTDLLAVYNLEFCGQGDTVALWPVAPGEGGLAVDNAIGTLKEMGCPYAAAPVSAWLFSSDHRPFRRRGFPDAITLSVVPSGAVDELRRFAASPWAALKLALGGRSRVPDFLRRIHTHRDTSEHLSEASLRLASQAVYRMVVDLDRRSDSP